MVKKAATEESNINELEQLIQRLHNQGAHTISVKKGDVELVVQFTPRIPQQPTDLREFRVDDVKTKKDEEDEELIYAASL